MIKASRVIDLRGAIEELEEMGIIDQFDELNLDIMRKILDRANEIANEE